MKKALLKLINLTIKLLNRKTIDIMPTGLHPVEVFIKEYLREND